MVLTPVTEAEVAGVIRGLNSKRAGDINGLSMWLLKRCYKHILGPLTMLINLSFAQGIFPDTLKTAKITPVFKKGDARIMNNYRPISILPVMSKVFEKIFANKLSNYLDRFEILSNQQYGFRKNKSTIDAVTKLVESVVCGLERHERVLSIFLDLSKAFDCVQHSVLLQQLKACGVRGLPLDWLSSFLRDRDQVVQVGNFISGKTKITQGVPQGSILGPLLFIIYVNNLNLSIQNGKMIQYADDTTLCFKAGTKQELEINSFIQLHSCIQYLTEIGLKTNSSKTDFINFSLRQIDRDQPAVLMDDILLEGSDSVKFLGMYLDRGLTWENHIDHVCSKVTSGIFVLRNLSKFCSLEVLKMAYYGLIYSHMVYGLRLWGGCARYRWERVFRLQKKAVRIIAKLTSRESCRGVFVELGLMTLPCLYMLEVILFCKFQCELTRGQMIHQYETRGRDTYRVQRHRTIAFEQLPAQVGVKLINQLPEDLKKLNSKTELKKRLGQFLLAKEFYSVDEYMESRWE